MPSFEELIGDPVHLKNCSSLGYWIGTLKGEAPINDLSADHLASVMTIMYDVEDQCFSEEYREIDAFTDRYFSPIAPVSLTRKWCPLDSSRKWLGTPVWEEVAGEAYKAAAALWEQPEYDVLDETEVCSEDEAHFLFLLRLALHRSIGRGENILLVCQPGWCFDHALGNPLRDFGYSSLEAGRIYPERVPSGYFKSDSKAIPAPAIS